MQRGIRRILCRILWLTTILSGIPAVAVEVIDDDGHSIKLLQPASRIVSLAPSLTEMLFAAGAGSRIVGVVEYSDYPLAAKEITVVGRHNLLDLEAILALQPDLIVSWKTGNPAAYIRQLKELGFPVYVAEPRQLQSIPLHIEKLGILSGTTETATSASNRFTATLNQLQADYSSKPEVSVFYQVWDTPLITAGGNELINDIISLCGGRNIFADLSLVAPKVSKESVLARNPQIIIASGMDIARPEWLDSWLEWPSLPAVSHGHLYFIPPDLLQRHTPRALQGATAMCEQINNVRLKN
ncbi:MAG: cobalamin-binding protein [Gammaproteobacteria bacterium]|nr:cobalamin-binding protein [Gammaproteobacteria bacterium]